MQFGTSLVRLLLLKHIPCAKDLGTAVASTLLPSVLSDTMRTALMSTAETFVVCLES